MSSGCVQQTAGTPTRGSVPLGSVLCLSLDWQTTTSLSHCLALEKQLAINLSLQDVALL